MIKLRNIYNTYTYISIYIQLNTHIYMQINKHKQSKKLRFYQKIYIKKRSMYNMIHANQQDIHWKQYSLFNVDQVDEHEKYKS